ncbi:POK7 protein, partial [Onychorhynchus coronatus]|nr:POK7 protein [Onychorhynchus coronatus]
QHFLATFAHMGAPKQVKTDNGPSYMAKAKQDFLALWGIEHRMGIPHSPTGQGIVAHHT